MKQIKDKEFSEEVKSQDLVIVDFFGTFCGPCKRLAPILEELEVENKEKVKIVKLDIEESPETPAHYGIRGVPTLLFFRKGELVETMVGLKSKEALQSAIDNLTPKVVDFNEDF